MQNLFVSNIVKLNIKLIKGDITKVAAQAIVNAANRTLLGGGGVDGAIHRTAGPELLDECKKLNGCDVGSAKITKGYNLESEYVIHTVGPVWKGGNSGESELLTSCYVSCFQLAVEHEISSIAFPAISTGVYHYPVDKATEIAIAVLKDWVNENDAIKQVSFVCFSDQVFDVYKQQLSRLE